jgi:hypothetical protein
MKEIKFRAWNTFTKRMFQLEALDLSGKRNPLNILLQYTGLKDSKGVEIYEGDIVKTKEGEIIEIKWDEIGWAGYFAGEEIIGNIYENTELIPNQSQ